MDTVIWLFVGMGCALVVAVLLLLLIDWVSRRRARRWRIAVRAARWEAAHDLRNGKSSLVVVRKVARVGRRSRVLDQHFVGSVALDRVDYVQELLDLELEATTRAIQLNAGAVT